MADTVRIGRVSKVNYATGMIEATYPQYDDCVTPEFPVLSFNDEYKMPKVGDEILVLHLSNGAAAGVVMGHYWNETNPPPENGAGLYRKDFAAEFGVAFARYLSGTYTLKADNIVFQSAAGTVTVADIIAHLRTHDS